MGAEEHDVTLLLHRMEAGDEAASSELFEKVYSQLRHHAKNLMAGERGNHTLQATALVNEAYIKLVGGKDAISFNDRKHFFAIACNAMRRILVDHARNRHRLIRGGDNQPVALMVDIAALASSPDDMVAIDEALSLLQPKHARKVAMVEHHYFGGLSLEETAEILGVTKSMIKKDWTFTRAFLRQVLEKKKS